MDRSQRLYRQLDAAAAQLNQLAPPGRHRRPSALGVAALVGLALTLAIGSRKRHIRGR
jgi:hypothetical protein